MKVQATILRRPLLFGLIVFVTLLFLTQYLTYQRYLLRRNAEEKEVISVANAARERMQATLNYSFSASKILAFVVENFGEPKNFDSLAYSLLRSNKFIDAVQLTRKGTIIQIYPLKGNESVIGYDILADSSRNREALKAIRKKELFFSGPFELKQGGLGIVGRQPIFIREEFWGFAAVIMRLPTLLREAGISNSESSDFAFELSKTDPNTQKEEFFLKYPATFNKSSLEVVDVPDGKWNLYVQRKKTTSIEDILPFALLGVVLSFIGAVFAWHRTRQPLILKGLVKIQTEKISADEKNYRTLLESITDAFVALDRNWCYTYMNKKAGQIFNRDPAAMAGKHIWTEFPEGVGQPFQKAYEKAMKENKYIYLEEHYEPYDLWFENHIYPTDNGIAIFFQEVTKRKRNEIKILKTSRLYDFSRQVNQVIIDVTNENELFKSICDTAVSAGNFRMAWVGIINDELHTVDPVSFSGEESGYLVNIKKITTDNIREGNGPAGTALREGKTVVCNDIEADPRMEPWRAGALKRGYRSSVSLPFKKMGKVTGALSLYAAEKNFFDQEETEMLEQIAANISFSLDNYEKEKLRRQAEVALRTSETFIRSLINASPDVIYIYDTEERKNVYINEGMQKNLGYSDREVKDLGENVIAHLMHPDDFSIYLADTYPKYEHLPDNQLLVHEFRMKDKKGEWRWLLAKEAIYLRNTKDLPKQIFGVASDITERKKAELVLKETSDLLRSVFDSSLIGFSLLETIRNENGEVSDFRYKYASRATETINNRADLTGKIYSDIHSNFKSVGLFDMLKGVVESGQSGEMELYYSAEGFNNWFQTYAVKLGDGVMLSFEDITVRKTAERKVYAEKEISDTIINSLPGIFYLYNRQGKFYRWNKNFETVSGYSAAEIEKMHPLEFFDNPDKELLEQKIRSVFLSGEDTVEADFLLKSKEKIPHYFTGRSIDYHGELCLMGVGIDISERVKAQEEIRQASEQLRELTAYLQRIREEERKRIGREIHDELGQQLTAIKMDVAWIDKKTPAEAEQVKLKLRNIITLLDSSNLSIRKILNELRMGVLEYQSLEEALRWQGQQFTDNTGIPLDFNCPKPIINTDETVATCLFRVFQESLTNITRYAKANKVTASLTQAEQCIKMSIEDDGRGFDTTELRSTKSFGILGMKERVTSLNGKFELITAPGKGTRIEIRIPVNLS
jgi:PAS domain S-box-containing protein